MASCDSFQNIPFEFLLSCVKHPHLTVDSEKHLCDAILLWLAANTSPSNLLSSSGDTRLEILAEIRTSLLSLPFAAGKQRCPFFSKFAERSVAAICSLATSRSFSLADILGDGDCNQLSIRLTEYTKILDLSGCPQINLPILLLNMLPSNNLDKFLMKKLNQLSLKFERHMDIPRIPWESFPVLTFEAVQVVDVSNCPMLHLEAAIECFSKSFPSLTTLKAAYILNFRTMELYQLLQRCPLLSDIDLTVDSTPVIPAEVSVISSFPAVAPPISTSSNDETCSDVPAFDFSRKLSNITKFILEGRTDVYDSDLQNIAECCPSLCFINLNACTSITDSGISILILKCVELHSIFACDTSFGHNSVLSLCRNISRYDTVAMKMADHINSLAYKLQILHIGGCKGISEISLLELISQTHRIRSFCLRETQLVDNSLYKFSGSSLEMLDVSDTKVVSDSVVRNIWETLKNLQVLALCYCFGEISSLSFQSSAPRLRKLTLERVSAQMTNDDLFTLTQNCMNLTELSLVGCRRLNSESQDTISNGWPGLISLHLEDCGEVTAKGVTSLMNCQVLEDLLLRHNGRGIDRNFIIHAAARMLLLRKIAVDVCDAKDGDFDLPDFTGRNFLRIVKIARCNIKRRHLVSTKSGTCTTPVHVETLILTWDSRKLSRTVIKERL